MYNEEYIRKAVAYVKEIRRTNGTNYKFGGSPSTVNARAGVVENDGELKDLVTYPCHAHLKQAKKPVITWSVLMNNPEEEYQESTMAYFDWITSKSSPWFSMLPKGEIIIDEENVISPEFMKTHGFIFPHIDELPSNVQHNFLVASRMAKEWPGMVKSWLRLQNEFGFTPEWAFTYMSLWCTQSDNNYVEFLKEDGPKEYTLSPVNIYDFPLDTVTSSEGYILNFLRSNMVGEKNQPFSYNCNYIDPYTVNGIWGVLDNSYRKEFIERYSHLSESYKVKNIAGKIIQKEKFLADQVLNIGVTEQNRLYKLINDK